jgi:serine protease
LIPAAAPAYELIDYQGHDAVAGAAKVLVVPGAARKALLSRLESRGFKVGRIASREGVALAPNEWSAVASAERERFVLVQFDAARPLARALAELAHINGIAAAYPDYVLYPDFVPNDPLYSQYQGNLREIYLEKAWGRTRGAGATVAVIDTGYSAAGLTDGVVNLLTGYDFADGDADVSDHIGHGTQVANVIAAATNNGIGAAGAAGDAAILPCKVFRDGSDGARSSDIVQAIDWAVAQGANVINMSLGGGDYDGATAAAVHDAVEAGVVVAVASGNDGQNSVSYPAAYPDAIAVGSCDQHAAGDYPRRSNFSNYGDELDLVAPGDSILGESNYNGQIGFYLAAGTSLSSPQVAAAAALLVSGLGEDYTVDQVRSALQQTATRAAGGDWDYEIGWGEVNVAAAMDLLLGAPANQPPTAKISAEPLSGPAPLKVSFAAGAADGDGKIVGYLWSFSTGESTSLLSFDHVFEQPGEYTVYLSVTDDGGTGASDNVTINVTEPTDSGDDDESGKRSGCGIGGGADAATALGMLAGLLGLWIARRRGA